MDWANIYLTKIWYNIIYKFKITKKEKYNDN